MAKFDEVSSVDGVVATIAIRVLAVQGVGVIRVSARCAIQHGFLLWGYHVIYHSSEPYQLGPLAISTRSARLAPTFSRRFMSQSGHQYGPQSVPAGLGQSRQVRPDGF